MKKIRLVIILFICVLFLTGCNGNITRDIRHEGFNLAKSSFKCSDLMPDKDGNYNKVKFIGNSFVVTEKGNVYDLSMGQEFANKENCKKANFKVKINGLFDGEIGRGTDGKFYHLTNSNNYKAYEEVSVNDTNYLIYKLLLGDKNIIKVKTHDKNSGSYYVLKSDGNVYNYLVIRNDYRSPFTISSIIVIYDSSNFDGKIIDFNDVGNSILTYVRTNNSIYRNDITNKSECNKYADVACKYKLGKNEVLTTNKDEIIGYNGNLLITKYGRYFTIG